MGPGVIPAGYWTDAGAAYYYGTQGNASYETTLKAVRSYHLDSHIPVRYYQLDSWWYTKGLDDGTLLWAPNPATIPSGLTRLAHTLNAPLALHNRYWSATTPYLLKEVGGQPGCVGASAAGVL